MRTEIVLRWVACGCAIFMLFGPFADRTSWGRGQPSITDSAGYNYAALFSGVVALVALAISLWARPRLALTVLGTVVAMAAFGFTAYVAGAYWQALSRGEALIDGAFVAPERLTMNPASGPPFFAIAAIIGALSAFGLTVEWLRQGRR